MDTEIQNLKNDVQTLTQKLYTLNAEFASAATRLALTELAMGTFIANQPDDVKQQYIAHLRTAKLDLIEAGLPNTVNDLISALERGPIQHGPRFDSN